MNIYELSPTRAIAHYGKYGNEMFKGSTINREKSLYEKQYQKTKEAEARIRKKVDGEWEDTASDLFTNQKPEFTYRKKGLQFSCLLSDALHPRSRKATSSHKLSIRSKYKIRDKIESLYAASNGTKFTFLTLTFINKVKDKEAQKVLNKFLTVARQNFGKFIYVWVAERQENGNIHFHLIADRFFKISKFNALWIMQQYNSGIRHPDYTQREIKEHYIKNTLQKILNPVDVVPVNSITGLSIYLTMYVTKNNDTFNCRVWHCCRKISALFTKELITQKTFEKAKQKEINFSVNNKTGEVYEAKTFVSPHAIVVQIYNKKYFGRKLEGMNTLNRWIIEYSYQNNEMPLKQFFRQIPEVNALNYTNDYCFSKTSKIVIPDFKKLPKKKRSIADINFDILNN